MSDIWRQFVLLKTERESIHVKKRLVWLLISQAICFAVFFALLADNPGTQSMLDSRVVHGLAFLFPALGIMISTSVLIGNFAAYTSMSRIAGWAKMNNTGSDSESLVLKGRTTPILSLIITACVAMAILVSWIIVLSLMTCAYQFPGDAIYRIRSLL